MGVRETEITRLLSLKHPLIVAPMAGGPTTVDLVVASSEAGALGSLGAAYLNPDAITEAALQIRARTKRPYSINLFVSAPTPLVPKEKVEQAIRQTQPFRDELKLPSPAVAPPYEENFDDQFEAVLRAKPALFSFVFGIPSPEHLKEARRNGLFIAGGATSLAEAEALVDAGVDAIVAQGFEAGGHRAILDASSEDPAIPASELLKALVGKIRKPVIAAGGIMNRRHIEDRLTHGAAAVQMGTAFLTTKEAGTSAPYRKRLLESPIRETKTTRAFSGRLARGLVNRFMREMDAHPDSILPFPIQNKFTRDLRNAAVKAGSADFLSLWCGSGPGELWTGSTADLIAQLFPS